jgi:LPPG:FO 2-phospho-L-lactate transferase
MSEQRVRTMLDTDRGELAFQTYFVRERCTPRVQAIRYLGADAAVPSAALLARLHSADGVIICPSNPWLSVDPILAVGDLRARIAASRAVAVSPIVGGRALKGPAAALMEQLGLSPSALEVARHYRGLLRGFVLDREDAAQADAVRALGMDVLVTDTVMTDAASKARLAAEVLAFLPGLRA